MTEITDAARQMAADLANAEMRQGYEKVGAEDFAHSFHSSPTQLALARLCAEVIEERARFIAMQKDMACIDRFALENDWQGCGGSRLEVAAIAAKHRAEVDPIERLREWAKQHSDVTPLDGTDRNSPTFGDLRALLGKAKP